MISTEIIDNSDKGNFVGVRNLLFYEIKKKKPHKKLKVRENVWLIQERLKLRS